MKREADPLPDDDDRTIGACLVELPSGKVLARTEWRDHDRLQYLWNLGHGRFLLRVRDRLTMIAPMPQQPRRCVPGVSVAADRAAYCGSAGLVEQRPADDGDG